MLLIFKPGYQITPRYLVVTVVMRLATVTCLEIMFLQQLLQLLYFDYPQVSLLYVRKVIRKEFGFRFSDSTLLTTALVLYRHVARTSLVQLLLP